MTSLADMLQLFGSPRREEKHPALEALALLEPVVARAAVGAVRNGLGLKEVAEGHRQLERLTEQVRRASRDLSEGISAAAQGAARTAQISLQVSEVSTAGSASVQELIGTAAELQEQVRSQADLRRAAAGPRGARARPRARRDHLQAGDLARGAALRGHAPRG